jgi:hypothetical protein
MHCLCEHVDDLHDVCKISPKKKKNMDKIILHIEGNQLTCEPLSRSLVNKVPDDFSSIIQYFLNQYTGKGIIFTCKAKHEHIILTKKDALFLRFSIVLKCVPDKVTERLRSKLEKILPDGITHTNTSEQKYGLKYISFCAPRDWQLASEYIQTIHFQCFGAGKKDAVEIKHSVDWTMQMRQP